jgi:type III secretory pathway component EscV
MTLASKDELARLNIPGGAITDRLTEREAHWISPADAERLPGPHWDTAEYLTRHLESVLRANLAHFAGLQETVGFLTEVWSPVSRNIATDPIQVARFARALQALVSESVPVIAKEAICEVFAKQSAEESSMDDLLIAMRGVADVAKALPGNQDGARLYTLSEDVERRLASSLIPLGDEHALAISPELTQDVLTAVRNKVPARSRQNETIVVRDARVRRYVRKLVELEFPYLHALSEAEQLEPLRGAPRTVIALGGAPGKTP